MNAYFLYPTAVTRGADWKDLNTFNLRNMLYQGPEGFSTPRKPVLALQQVNVLPIYAESNYE